MLKFQGLVQMEAVLRQHASTPALPEAWELLYKIARDMSRAAGAEELVNSLQTAAESYLVVSLLLRISTLVMASFACLNPCLDHPHSLV